MYVNNIPSPVYLSGCSVTDEKKQKPKETDINSVRKENEGSLPECGHLDGCYYEHINMFIDRFNKSGPIQLDKSSVDSYVRYPPMDWDSVVERFNQAGPLKIQPNVTLFKNKAASNAFEIRNPEVIETATKVMNSLPTHPPKKRKLKTPLDSGVKRRKITQSNSQEEITEPRILGKMVTKASRTAELISDRTVEVEKKDVSEKHKITSELDPEILGLDILEWLETPYVLEPLEVETARMTNFSYSVDPE